MGRKQRFWEEEDYDSLIELLAIGLQTSPEEWIKLRYHPTAWSKSGTEEGHKATQAQVKALTALADVVANPSPVARSALLHPIFEAAEILGGKRNASSRGSSTTASSKDSAHIQQTRAMLAVIVKSVDTAVQATEPPLEQAPLMNVEGLKPALKSTAGKNAARNRRRKDNDKAKGKS